MGLRIFRAAISLVVIFCFAFPSFAQDSIPSIGIIGKAAENGIVLRWAPTTPVGWYLSLTSGYKLERLEMLDSSEAMSGIGFEVLQDRILPWALDQWQGIAPPKTNDSYAAVAAQMIYGDKWSAQSENSGIIDKVDELKNRYAYATLAADFSANTADASGLRWVDTSVLPNHTYIYRIISLVNSDQYLIDTGYAVVHSNQVDSIPVPEIAEIIPGDRVLHVRWSRSIYSGVFTAFFLERSEDGKKFTRLHESPYLSSANEGDSLSAYFFSYSDSIAENYRNYYYRIAGITPFAEISVPSAVMVTHGVDLTPPAQPYNVKTSQIGPTSIKIEWDYDELNNPDLKGFLIGHSNDVLDHFRPLNFVPISEHYFIHDSADALLPNFYLVAAIDTAGNNNLSLSTYGHLVDSIPPIAPTGLQGTVDSSGNVHLTWDANVEPDILGYTVHYSNDSTHVFANITDSAVLINQYTDRVMIRSLTEEVYYKVVAVDRNYNYSGFSQMLALKKPDLIPPSSPVFKDFSVDTTSIALQWLNSSSLDVVKHQLWRKLDHEEWSLIGEFENFAITSFIDHDLPPGRKISYKILAVDDAGNTSASAFNYELQTQKREIDLSGFELNISRVGNDLQLTWPTYPDAGAYLIYRSENQGLFLHSKKTKETTWIDKSIDRNSEYTYRVRIIKNDGQYTGYSRIFNQP